MECFHGPIDKAAAEGVSRRAPALHTHRRLRRLRADTAVAALLLADNGKADEGKHLVRAGRKETELILSVIYKGKPTHHALVIKGPGQKIKLNGKETPARELGTLLDFLRQKRPKWPVPLTTGVRVDAAPGGGGDGAADAEESAAVAIQAGFRGYMARKAAAAKRAQVAATAAADEEEPVGFGEEADEAEADAGSDEPVVATFEQQSRRQGATEADVDADYTRLSVEVLEVEEWSSFYHKRLSRAGVAARLLRRPDAAVGDFLIRDAPKAAPCSGAYQVCLAVMERAGSLAVEFHALEGEPPGVLMLNDHATGTHTLAEAIQYLKERQPGWPEPIRTGVVGHLAMSADERAAVEKQLEARRAEIRAEQAAAAKSAKAEHFALTRRKSVEIKEGILKDRDAAKAREAELQSPEVVAIRKAAAERIKAQKTEEARNKALVAEMNRKTLGSQHMGAASPKGKGGKAAAAEKLKAKLGDIIARTNVDFLGMYSSEEESDEEGAGAETMPVSDSRQFTQAATMTDVEAHGWLNLPPVVVGRWLLREASKGSTTNFRLFMYRANGTISEHDLCLGKPVDAEAHLTNDVWTLDGHSTGKADLGEALKRLHGTSLGDWWPEPLETCVLPGQDRKMAKQVIKRQRASIKKG